MVIEEFGSSHLILVDRLRDAVGLAEMVPNLGFFLSVRSWILLFSLPRASSVRSDDGFYGTSHLVRAIAVLTVFHCIKFQALYLYYSGKYACNGILSLVNDVICRRACRL